MSFATLWCQKRDMCQNHIIKILKFNNGQFYQYDVSFFDVFSIIASLTQKYIVYLVLHYSIENF